MPSAVQAALPDAPDAAIAAAQSDVAWTNPPPADPVVAPDVAQREQDALPEDEDDEVPAGVAVVRVVADEVNLLPGARMSLTLRVFNGPLPATAELLVELPDDIELAASVIAGATWDAKKRTLGWTAANMAGLDGLTIPTQVAAAAKPLVSVDCEIDKVYVPPIVALGGLST